MSGTTGWTSNNAIDLDNVSTEPPGPPEEGIYKVRVTKAEPEATKDGDPGVAYELHVEGAYSGDPSAIEGKSLNLRFNKLTFSQGALWKLKAVCHCFDVSPPKSTSFEDVSEFAEQLVDKEGWVKLKRRVNPKDKTRFFAEVDRYFTQAQADEAAQGATADATGDASAEAPKRPRRRAA
jgi:hypothetical protein